MPSSPMEGSRVRQSSPPEGSTVGASHASSCPSQGGGGGKKGGGVALPTGGVPCVGRSNPAPLPWRRISASGPPMGVLVPVRPQPCCHCVIHSLARARTNATRGCYAAEWAGRPLAARTRGT